jgi:hypothetical protein
MKIPDELREYMSLFLPALAGFLGSVFALRWIPGETLTVKAGNVVSGATFAIFVGPWACEFFGVDGLRATVGVGWVFGMFGVAFCDKSMEAIKGLQLTAIVTGWLSKAKE